jgi:hypothetical protein
MPSVGANVRQGVGVVMTGSGLLGIALQTPIGAGIDATRAKRGFIVLTIAAMTVAAIIIFVDPTFWAMAIALAVLALANDAFGPAGCADARSGDERQAAASVPAAQLWHMFALR